jgi:hypothetical protein
MLTATLILASLTLLLAMDESDSQDATQAIPVKSDDRDNASRR